MNLKSNKQEHHLAGIIHLLSMYQVLYLGQFKKMYPELSESKLLALIRRLEKSGRLVFLPDSGQIKYSDDCIPNPNLNKAFWLLLDFMPDVLFHTVSDFPVSITFCTESEVYDIICVQEGKEHFINHALSHIENDSSRLVIIDSLEQIANISFSGICAFCLISTDGQVQYYQRQGETDN